MSHDAKTFFDKEDALLGWALALTGLLGAIAAMAVPGTHGEVAEFAAVLAIGSVALLAGHRWGMIVVIAADILLLGSLWPLALAEVPASHLAQVAAGAATACALPGVFLFFRALPDATNLLLSDGSPRLLHGATSLAITGASALWVVGPALS